jgi:predicted ArsR family transcriptional regulator
VDEAPLSPTEFASTVTAITSAFGDPSRRDIFLFAHENPEGVTAGESAKAFDLHPNVARHHLDKLTSGGYLEVTVAQPSGVAGRPSKRYKTTASQVRLEVAVRHDDILVTLLGRALAMLPPKEAAKMAEEVGTEYGRSMAVALDSGDTHRSFRTALHAVADALSAHGFAAHAEKHDTELRIVAENCPFGDVAIEHPVICAVDRGMVQGMLSELYGPAGADTSASLPAGDEVCVTTVQP